MRSADRISRTPSEYADFKADERRRTLSRLLGSLRRTRDRREEWYVWVVEGQPILTAEQYEKVGTRRPRKRTSA